MKLAKPTRFQYYCWLVSMPLIAFAISYILYKDRIYSDWSILSATIPILYIIGFTSWYFHVQYTLYITVKFPSLQQTKQRIFLKLLVNLVVMTPSMLIFFFLIHLLRIGQYSIKTEDLKYGYLVGLSVNVIFVSLQEVIYLLNKYKENLAEEELLKQMQFEQEFENLKQKINPHFLFNCFNTLLYLITDDHIKAEKFLDELSKVYRYLLRNNENDISTVEQEITFIRSYAGLLKTRFGEGFQLLIEINENTKAHLLPSLTLQLLVENAVKHNVVSPRKPIKISIYSIGDTTLVVENTLAKKPSRVISTGIGLNSIKEKYRLIDGKTIQIDETATYFRVSLPLINSSSLTLQNTKVN